MQQQLSRHAQQPLSVLGEASSGGAPRWSVRSSGGGGWSSGGGAAAARWSTGGGAGGSSGGGTGVPVAARIMMRQRWEEEAEARVWGECSRRVSSVLRGSGPVGAVSHGVPHSGAGGSDGGASPMRACWAPQAAAAAAAHGSP